MQDGQASATALKVAEQRAAHQLFDAPLVFQDSLALPILGAGAVEGLLAKEAGFRTPFALAFRGGVVARSRYCEDRLADAVARGVRQVVLLGAGLDTLAYRNAWPPGTRLFEVDHPATQAWKRERLAAAGIAVPASLSFVPIDFERTTLAEGLRAGQVDPSRPAFFSWLGVAYYLPADTVLETLRQIGAWAPGSEVVLDYFEPAQNYAAADRPGFTTLGQEVAKGGEPWKSYFAPAELAAQLRALGFGKIEDLDSAAMAVRHFAGRTDGLAPAGPIHFVGARLSS